jgi:hypothetical protein
MLGTSCRQAKACKVTCAQSTCVRPGLRERGHVRGSQGCWRRAASFLRIPHTHGRMLWPRAYELPVIQRGKGRPRPGGRCRQRHPTISPSSLLRDAPRSSDELQFSCLFRVSLRLIPIEGSGGASREEIVNYGKKSTAGDSTEEDSYF